MAIPNAGAAQAPSNSAARRASILMIKAARTAGPRRFRRLADACREAGRHGSEKWRFVCHAEDALWTARDFSALRSHRHLSAVTTALERRYDEGARERGRIAADHHLSHHCDANPAAAEFLTRGVVEAVAWSAHLTTSEVESVAVEAMEAAGLEMSATCRSRLRRNAEMAVADRPSRLEWVPAIGEPWPEPVNDDPFVAPVVVGARKRLAKTAPVAHTAHPDPFAFDNLPGLLGDVARWSHHFAFKPVPEFAVASALAAMSVLFGRRFTTPTGLGLNVYIVGIAPTGGGKEAALAAPQALLDEAGFSYLLGPGDFTSDTAIEIALRSRPCQAMFLDEFGQLLGAVQGRNAPSFARLARKALLEIFTKSGPGGRWTGKARASDEIDKASAPIYSPTLTLLACSTIDGFFSGLTEDNLGDGFVNRLTVVRAKAVGARNMDLSRTAIPERLVLAIKAAWDASRVGEGNMPRMSGDKPALRPVPWADEAAEAAWLAVADWEDAEREKATGRDGIVGRASEQTQKFATLAALARDPGAPAVTVDNVRWAFALVKASIDTLDEGVSQNMAGSEFEALCKAIERAVILSGGRPVKMSDLLRMKGISKHDDRMVEAALKRLEVIGALDTKLTIDPKTRRMSGTIWTTVSAH